MTLKPIAGAPPGAPMPPFPGSTPEPSAADLIKASAGGDARVRQMAASMLPTPKVPAPEISGETARQITELRGKRMLTLRQAEQLADLEHERLMHTEFYKWGDAVHAVMPEFTRKEAIGIAMHAPTAGEWHLALPTLLKALAADDGRPADMRATYASAAEKARHIVGGRLTELQWLVRGMRIGKAPY